MNAIHVSAVQAELSSSDTHDAVYARAGGGTVVVPFSRSMEPVPPRAYARLHEPLRSNDGFTQDELGIKTLDKQDVCSIMTVLEHIAHSQDVKLEILTGLVEAEFSAASIAQIPHYQFHNVMEFLIDLRIDNIRSRR